MDSLIVILMVIYLLSIVGLAGAYGHFGVDITIWAISSLALPIVNTVILFYLWHPTIAGFKKFIYELKEKRKPNS